MEAMIANLQMAKHETWEEKERLSHMYEEERKKNLASKVCVGGSVCLYACVCFQIRTIALLHTP